MGLPKAWLPFGGEPMLARVVRAVRGAAGPVVVVAAPGQDVPPLPPEVRVARDEVEGRGPLAGLAAGLAALEGEADAAYLSSCDVPLLKAEFVRRVVSFLSGANAQLALARRSEMAAVPRAGGRLHPLAAAYRLDALPVVRERLAADRPRMLDLLGAVPARVIEAGEFADIDPRLLSLWNVNTPEDYEAALREAEVERPG
jgi:molybdopterin-guanine dinucleotide biosynthesis protein A